MTLNPVVLTDPRYEDAVQDLERTLADGRGRLDPETVRVLQQNLRRSVLRIQSQSAGRGSVDYEITAPQWMPLSITGTYNFITVEGAQSDVSAETTRGDITIKGGTGAVVAKSIEGLVVIEGVRGRITASSVNDRIRISDASGDITADTTNGDVTLTQITSSNVVVTTVNGDIRFDGPPAPTGRYRLTTHNGDVITTVPETSNATFIIRTYQGDFGSTLKVSGPPRGDARLGRRQTYTLGSGSAEFEVETFGGSIRLRAPGPATPANGRGKREDGKAPYSSNVPLAQHFSIFPIPFSIL